MARGTPLLLDGTNRLVQCHRNIVIADPELMVSANPSGLDGIEFVEYSTARPLVLGHVLELMGFQPVARHRSREVLLYRQGTMNVVINAHDTAQQPGKPVDERTRVLGDGEPDGVVGGAGPRPRELDAVRISAVAFRARDAAAAYRRALDRGAWAVPRHVEVMELNIPAIHGAGASLIYFVDRYREFSIYTVDFVPIPSAEQHPPAIAGMRWFGLVQYVGPGRVNEWTEYYRELFAFVPIPDDQRFGILPRGRILRSPCGGFYVQLIEPEPGAPGSHVDEGIRVAGGRDPVEERLVRVGLGTHDVLEAARILRQRGVDFMDTDVGRPTERGALTQGLPAGVMFELVRDQHTSSGPSGPT
jgi:4-hydroxyphenylpyruvate dioxygenase